MALYTYEAFTKEGKRLKGTVDAGSIAAVREQLSRQALYPISIYPAVQEARIGIIQRLFMRRVSLKEKILFSKQLAVLLKSGVPLLQAIELLADQFEGYMHIVLVSIKDEVKGGLSLAESMSEYPKVFDTIYVQLVRAGEASGKLDTILERLTGYMERRDLVRKKIRGAMQYPIIQLAVIILVVFALFLFVIPNLQPLFEALGENLPTVTRFVLNVSAFVRSYFIIMGIFFLVAIGIFTYWSRTASGARILDQVKLKIPIIKYISRTNAIVQFCYTLGLLVESGVNLAESLDIVVKIVDNRILADTLQEARDKIIKQGKIAQYLQQTNIFPKIAIHLIRTGEESGELGSMLLTVAENYEADLTELIDQATSLLSPIMLIVMAIIVGVIIFAIASPMMQAGKAFGIGKTV